MKPLTSISFWASSNYVSHKLRFWAS